MIFQKDNSLDIILDKIIKFQILDKIINFQILDKIIGFITKLPYRAIKKIREKKKKKSVRSRTRTQDLGLLKN